MFFFAKNLPIANKELTPIYCGENGIKNNNKGYVALV